MLYATCSELLHQVMHSVAPQGQVALQHLYAVACCRPAGSHLKVGQRCMLGSIKREGERKGQKERQQGNVKLWLAIRPQQVMAA